MSMLSALAKIANWFDGSDDILAPIRYSRGASSIEKRTKRQRRKVAVSKKAPYDLTAPAVKS